MKDETRIKYEKLLGSPEDRKNVGEMTEKELLLGRTLKRMREYRKITLETLSEGVCAPSDMAAMEKGMKASILMTSIYLTRMGKSVNKFEFYSTNAEYEQQYRRDLIVELWKSNELENAKAKLENYQKQFHSKCSERWCYWQKLCIGLREGEIPKQHEKIWLRMVKQKLYFTEEELDYLRELAKLHERRSEAEEVQEVYALMYANTMAIGVFLPQSGRGMDEERKLEILPELCLDYGKFEHSQGRNEHAIQILSTAIELLQKSMRMESLEELLTERMEIHKELWEKNADAEEYRKMGEDVQHLIALDLVHDNMKKAYERVCWLKEQMKWENTILDSLYIILEKRLD